MKGGVRTPLIISGPKIPKGKVVNEPAITMDVFSSILDILNIPLKDSRIDGKSLIASINGKMNKTDRPLFWHYPHYHSQGATPYSAVRLNKWKFYYFYEDGHTELYDLDSDLSEKTDISISFPNKVIELNLLLQSWLKKTNAQLPIPDNNFDSQKLNKKR